MVNYIAAFFLSVSVLFAPLAASVEKVVILGGGPAGLSAAIFTAQANLNPLVLTGSDCGGQMSIIHSIDNFPGFPEQIPGKELLERFQIQAEKFGARVNKNSIVVDADLQSRPIVLFLENGDAVYTETLIIAQGVNRSWLGLEAEQKLQGKGVMGTSLCSREEYLGKSVAVVGGGHAALQEAIMISEFASSVFLINRSDKFNASNYHQELAFANEKIQIFYESDVIEIADVEADKVTGITVHNRTSNEKISLPVDGVVIAIGSKPNSNIFDGQLELTATGHIHLPEKNTQTSVPGVFAAGDITERAYGRAAIAAGAGAMAALDVVRFLTNHKK